MAFANGILKKSVWAIFLLILTAGFLSAEDFFLVKDKAVSYFECPDKSVCNILHMFNNELKKTTGSTLPVNPLKTENRNRIKLVIRADKALHTEDEFSYSFPDEKTMLVSCTKISLQWFLNHVLENYAGVNYLFNDSLGCTYKKVRDVKIPRKNYSEKPSFDLGRFTYLSNPVTLRLFNMKRGARTNHDLHILCFPTKKYAKDNSYPAAIRPLINGKRLSKIPSVPIYWQPCYSNPETARVAIENIFEYLKENPGTQSISLTVNDCGGFCQCGECKKANGGEKENNYSEVYFTWVKRVAEAVGKKYPDLPVIALAYSSVYQPCSFKLPDNVVIALCMDIYSVTDPKIMLKHKKIIADWSTKAKKLGVWDYSWGYPYFPPRMYLKRHVEMLRYLYNHGCRLYFGENEAFNSKEGPKVWLIHKMLWNINQDENALLDFWYKEVAGEKAAPYLRKFYDFWEAYFQSDAIRKTPWFNSARATYMTGGDYSHIYGLKKGDLATARSFLEKALAAVETPEQKARIQKIEHTYKYSESLMKLYAGEVIPPEGVLKNAQQAADLLREIPDIVPYQKIKRTLSKELENDSWASHYYRKSFRHAVAIDRDGTDALIAHLMMASNFIHDPAVQAEMKKLAADSKLPVCVTKIAQILLKQAGSANLFTNGNVEAELAGDNFEIYPTHRRKLSGIRSTAQKAEGKYSYQLQPTNYTLLHLHEKADPEAYYLITMKIYLTKTIPETFLNLALYPALNKRNQEYKNQPQVKLEPGKWHTLTAFCRTRKNSNGLKGALVLKMFPRDAMVYVDDVQLYKIEE